MIQVLSRGLETIVDKNQMFESFSKKDKSAYAKFVTRNMHITAVPVIYRTVYVSSSIQVVVSVKSA